MAEDNDSISDLITKLTLDEKVHLLSAADWWRTLKINRDGVFVPHIKMSDGPNGARGESYVSGITAACFPCSTCVGATFDLDSAYLLGQEIAKQTKIKSANVILAPTLNVIRSPLGGRNYETYSEDPLVLGTMAAAFVNGCQSEGIAATPKHFVANETEKRRMKLTAEIDEQMLREIYLLPFQLVMRNADPWCFMTSYNRVNGEYVSDSSRLVTDILRKEWGFSGLVVSDWMGTYSTAKSLNAGMDLEMPGPTIWRGKKLFQGIESGEVSESTLDDSERILKGPLKAKDFIADLAADGAVLLKKDNNVFPISSNKSVAVIGHHGTVTTIGGGGSAKVLPQHIVTPLEGLQKAGLKCHYESGVPVFAAVPQADPTVLSGSDLSAREHDTIKHPVKLEWFNGSTIGESKVHEQYIPNVEYMIKEAWPEYLNEEYCTRMTFTLTPKTSGKHLLSAITTGTSKVFVNNECVYTRPQEPVLQPESFYFYKAKIEHRFEVPMKAHETYELRVESWGADKEVLSRVDGRVFQGSSLRFSEHVDIPKAINDAANTAQLADVAIVCVGTTNEIESEGYDRETMDLSPNQYSLILAVAEKNPNTIVVNFSGSPVTVSPFIGKVPALLQAWFPGQECGHSVAKVLTGRVNPSGRLPMSWPKRNEDNPTFGNFPCDDNDVIRYEEKLDIGYRYYDKPNTPDPQFPFGFGLSYCEFTLSGLRSSASDISWGEGTSLEISCDVRNTSSVDGKTVVQIYVSYDEADKVSGRARPPKELKVFTKLALNGFEQRPASFKLDKYAFSYYNADERCWCMPEGSYTISVGFSAVEILETANLKIHGTYHWTGV